MWTYYVVTIVITSNVDDAADVVTNTSAWWCRPKGVKVGKKKCFKNVVFVAVRGALTGLWRVCWFVVAYPVLSADPRRCVEADNGEKCCDFQPTDEQLLICDQVFRQRATCGEKILSHTELLFFLLLLKNDLEENRVCELRRKWERREPSPISFCYTFT